MKKKVKIYGTQKLKEQLEGVLMENIVENWEMKDTYSRANIQTIP